jgi:hypothetical protein
MFRHKAIAMTWVIIQLAVTPGLTKDGGSGAAAQKPGEEIAVKRQKVSFYFSPHGDDWQLFMNPPAFDNVLDTTTKVVFIHTTAGDAGLGADTGGRKHPYYLARENGSETAIRFMADAGQPPADRIPAWLDINGHRIYRVEYRNTAVYFLRLPDGSLEGAGYKETGFQSLKRLAEGKTRTITAVDGSAIYKGWGDLVATIRGILDRERGQASSVQLNLPDPDEAINPGDHPDHLMTGKAVLEAAKDIACASQFLYTGYAGAKLPENLNSAQKEQEISVFAATVIGLLALDHTSTWQPHYREFLGRNYYRVQNPAAACY